MRINSVPVARGVYAMCEPASSGALCVCLLGLFVLHIFKRGVRLLALDKFLLRFQPHKRLFSSLHLAAT